MYVGSSLRSVGLKALFALSLIASLAGFSFGQTATGTITGTITDPKGLSITNGNVVVRNMDTGISHLVTSNDAGVYVASLLQPGNYSLTVTKEGFAKMERAGVMLMVGQTLTLDFQMPLQTQQALVTVTAETPLIETSKTDQSQNVSDALVANLPLASRRWEEFVLLTPGVTTDGTTGLSSFHGISALYNNNSVDGANNTQAFFSEARGRSNIVSYVYSADSMKEFQVNNSNYNAELGQAAGGTVNAVTKSGSNQFHGDAFYNLRYPSLNALDPVVIVSAAGANTTPTQAVHQQHQFGASAGGPLIKDKLFLFATYDGFRKVNPVQYISSNPAIASFSCPAQIAATPSLCTAAQSFLLGQLGAFQRNLKQEVYFGKLDYQLNASNHLSAVLNIQNWQEPFGYNTAPTFSNGGASENGFGGVHNRFLIANWNTTISSNKLNEFRFQWGRDFEFDGTNSGGPHVSLASITAYGETSALPRPAFPDEHRYQVSDSFSYIRGKHIFKFGADFNFIHELLINLFQGDGNYSYSSPALPASVGAGCLATAVQRTFCGWVADTLGLDLGDGLLRKHYVTFTQVNDPITGVGKDDFYDDDYAAFAQDSWKIRPHLTLNLGVRYDIQHVPAPPQPNTQTPLLQLYTSTLNIDKNNIAPRIGVAWSVTPTTVIRAGYGIFYGKTSNSTYYALRVENGIYQITYSGCGPLTKLSACAPLFPNVFFTPPGPALAAPFAGALAPVIQNTNPPLAAQAVHGMTPDFQSPEVQSANVSVERELPGHISVSATYLLTRGEYLPASYDANVVPTTLTKSYDVVNSAGATQLVSTVPFYTTRLNPSTGIILNQYSVVNSWYHGLVLSFRKPLSHDVEVLANYTLSRARDTGQISGGTNSMNNSGTFFGTDGVLDPYNLKEDYANSDIDQRQRFVSSVVWTPSYAKKFSSKAVRTLASDWSLSTIVTAGSGQPYTATIGTFTPPGSVNGGMTGAVVGTFASSTGGRAAWLPRNSYNLPGWTNVDFRVEREFTMRERYRLAIVADAFNLFNSTIVSAVNTQGYTESNPGSGVCAGHVNACIVPFSSFQSRTTTSSSVFGARQLQLGARFTF
jgi:carboxypeptidase family protein